MWQSCPEDPLLIAYCPDKYVTQKISDEVADNLLATLKLIPDWFAKGKIIKKNFTPLFADKNIFYFNEDFSNVVLNWNKTGILNIDLNIINLDNNFDKDDPDTIILIKRLAWHIKFEKHKALKKELNEELVPIAWQTKNDGIFACQKMRKKR